MRNYFKSMLLGAVLLGLVACQQKEMTFQEIFPVTHVTKLEVITGSGEKTIITDEAVVNDWLKGMKATTFTPKKNQEAMAGYLYAVKMYDGEKEIGNFTTSKIKDYYYESNAELEEKIASLLN